MLPFWILFNLFVLCALGLDLAMLRKHSRPTKFKEAILSTAIWVALTVAFGVVVYFWRGSHPALEFGTAYLIEEALSADNLFVFLLLFSYFKVPPQHQREVLLWGILGALVMRAAFILGGLALINRFHWVAYGFGIFLIYTGIMLLRKKDATVNPQNNLVLKLLRKLVPISEVYEGKKFFVRRPVHGTTRLLITPLFAVLVLVESTDLMFATDSIPAVLAISRDPFIVYTSNVFAILGLRSLYFALAGVIQMFHYLNLGLAAILVLIGMRMVLADIYQLSVGWSLAAVAIILCISVVASLLLPKKESPQLPVNS